MQTLGFALLSVVVMIPCDTPSVLPNPVGAELETLTFSHRVVNTLFRLYGRIIGSIVRPGMSSREFDLIAGHLEVTNGQFLANSIHIRYDRYGFAISFTRRADGVWVVSSVFVLVQPNLEKPAVRVSE